MGNSSSRPRAPSPPRLDQLELAPGTLLLAIAREDFPKAPLPKVIRGGGVDEHLEAAIATASPSPCSTNITSRTLALAQGALLFVLAARVLIALIELQQVVVVLSVEIEIHDPAMLLLFIVGIVIVVVLLIAGCTHYCRRRRRQAAEKQQQEEGDEFIRGRIIRAGLTVTSGEQQQMFCPGDEVLARAHCGQPMKVDVLGVGNTELLFLFHRHDVKAVVVSAVPYQQQEEHDAKKKSTKSPQRATPSAPPAPANDDGGEEWELLR